MRAADLNHHLPVSCLIQVEAQHSVYEFPPFSISLTVVIIIISIQPEGQFWQEPEPSQATGMAPAHCIVGYSGM